MKTKQASLKAVFTKKKKKKKKKKKRRCFKLVK